MRRGRSDEGTVGGPSDPARDCRGVGRERRALVVTAAVALIGLGATALARSRPGIDRPNVLRPPSDPERFVVYVNEDDWATVALLPRIGATLARRIVASRERDGRFGGPPDLARVRGIGAKTVAALRPYVRFGRRPTTTRAARSGRDR